jgi:hypothetical protein
MQKLQNQSLGFKQCEEFNEYFQCRLGKKITVPGIHNLKYGNFKY